MKYTLHKRGDYYHLDVTIDSRRIRRTTKQTSKGKANIEARRIIRELTARQAPDKKKYDETLTFNDLADLWLKRHCEVNVSRKFMEDNVSRLRNHLRPRIGGLRLWEFDAGFAADFKAELKKKYLDSRGYSPVTVNHLLRLLRNIFSKAVLYDIVDRNPWKTVKDFPVPEKQVQMISKEEMSALLSSFEGKHLARERVMILANTGLRLGELGGLRVGDVDLARKVIHVRRAIDVRNGGSVGPTKSRRSRYVPISDAILPVLESLTRDRDPDDWLLLNPQVDFPYARMTRSIRTACMRAGLGGLGITPHYFRHWYATQFLAQGGDPVVLMKCLGHREFRTTLRYYEHMDIEPLVRQRNVVSVGDGLEG